MADTPRVHVHMTVSDLAKSREFLSEGRPAEGRGHVDHMGIQVESREIVVRELARVTAAGLAVRAEFGVDCCHANQDKFWVRDPDGVEWEVYVLNRDLEETPRGLPLAKDES